MKLVIKKFVRKNEKDHVERSVKFVRRKAFANKDVFNSLDEANTYLLSSCEILNKTRDFNKDKSPVEFFQEENAICYLL